MELNGVLSDLLAEFFQRPNKGLCTIMTNLGAGPLLQWSTTGLRPNSLSYRDKLMLLLGQNSDAKQITLEIRDHRCHFFVSSFQKYSVQKMKGAHDHLNEVHAEYPIPDWTLF